MCRYRILSALNLSAGPWKFQKYYTLHGAMKTFRLMWPQPVRASEHSKCLFSVKMTKMPLVNPTLTKSQMMSKSSQNNIFMVLHQTWATRRLFSSLTEVDQVWPKVDPRQAIETLILIWQSEWVETNTIVKIIKFSF